MSTQLVGKDGRVECGGRTSKDSEGRGQGVGVRMCGLPRERAILVDGVQDWPEDGRQGDDGHRDHGHRIDDVT